MLLYEIRKKTGEIPYKKRKEIKEGVTLELEGDSVLIQSFVLKGRGNKKVKGI
ncbi:MAG: hypothetical protein ACLUR5_03185 [Eubacterium ventriosum]